MNWAKIGGVVLAAVLLLNLAFFLFGRTAALVFWAVIIAAGVYAFVIAPHLRQMGR